MAHRTHLNKRLVQEAQLPDLTYQYSSQPQRNQPRQPEQEQPDSPTSEPQGNQTSERRRQHRQRNPTRCRCQGNRKRRISPETER